jgi:hypothetical protein
MDLMKCAEAAADEQILGRARDVCHSIDIMVGHTARIVNQERYWPAMLDKMKNGLEYDHVLLKSDYWKKFEGTAMKQGKQKVTLTHPLHLTLTLTITCSGKCETAPKQSVETHR